MTRIYFAVHCNEFVFFFIFFFYKRCIIAFLSLFCRPISSQNTVCSLSKIAFSQVQLSQYVFIWSHSLKQCISSV